MICKFLDGKKGAFLKFGGAKHVKHPLVNVYV